MSSGLLSLCQSAASVLRTPALRGVLILTGSIALAGCQSKASDAPAGGFGPPSVSVAPAVQREVQEFDEFTGRLEAPQSVDVRSRVTGYIKAVHFHDGQEVKQGDPLFTIDPDPIWPSWPGRTPSWRRRRRRSSWRAAKRRGPRS